MKVLVACEESQRVTIELRRLGHEAYSCDIEPCSGGRPEWHIQQDALTLINGRCTFKTADGTVHSIASPWDMLIAHPPCTYLSNVGAPHLRTRDGELNTDRYQKGLQAKEFFMRFLNADCTKIAVENPVPGKIYGLPPYTQIIQPWQFGDPYQKKTCLWLRGLPPLEPTDIVNQRQPTTAAPWFNKGGRDRQKNRSKTFPGIAKAMAEQWTREGVKKKKEEIKKKSGIKMCYLCGREINLELIEPCIIKTKRGSDIYMHTRCFMDVPKMRR